jgi:hypothetical protein
MVNDPAPNVSDGLTPLLWPTVAPPLHDGPKFQLPQLFLDDSNTEWNKSENKTNFRKIFPELTVTIGAYFENQYSNQEEIILVDCQAEES